MEGGVALRGVGVRFRVPRRSRLGKVPRVVGMRRWTLWGLRGVSLDVGPGEVVGLIGPNGAGKSTLLRVIAGIYVPDEGSAEVHGRVTPFLTPSAGLALDLSGWENVHLGAVLLGFSRAEARRIAPRVAEFSGLGDFLDVPVRTYSAGMRVRLGFSLVAFADPDVIVIDEALTAGDEEFRERSTRRMRELIAGGATVVMATHNLRTLKDLCHRVVRLDEGRLVEQGPPGEVLDHYLEDLHRAGRQGELRRLQGAGVASGPPSGQLGAGRPVGM
ncbi:MAG TPA: ATP-binding cassette domain-containing protein [Actinomycetota bacterium]|nr:ATP-binding cassette domain-containing protein [Actinomycetota bacterium]